ncbi:hypothetical protein BC940DRAFT_333925 [Gongronella butleri]|nr:hypothetical protein BC940DRAFT_333925 [Gongronella butleri]
MDTDLNSTLDTIASEEGVQGVLVVDSMGFSMGARGDATKESAAFIASMATAAISLQQQTNGAEAKSDYPIITVEHNSRKIVIRPQGTFTLAIFM